MHNQTLQRPFVVVKNLKKLLQTEEEEMKHEIEEF